MEEVGGGPPAPARCPWGRAAETSAPEPCSLIDVMSEQLASELQEDEDKAAAQGESFETILEFSDPSNLADTKNDELLAQLLQERYNREHNELLQRKEKKYNGDKKVCISFQKFHLLADPQDHLEEYGYDDVYEPKSEWEKTVPQFSRSGISGKGKNITTKHDATICGRRNASKIMEFPPEFFSGDGEVMDMKLPNHVYNKLKVYSATEKKRSQRVQEKKDHSTAEMAMDPRTRLLLYKLVNNEILETINGSISSGKESVVFHAYGGRYKNEPLPAECAIKVYMTTLNKFKTRQKYIQGDHRFSGDDYKKQNPRKIIKIWAEKETANLKRMVRFGLRCPKVILLRKHVLVLSFIGKDQQPAPKLKEAKLDVEQISDAYIQTHEIMKKLYNDCKLVHADLSEYNLLWHDNQVWVIDVSQSVELMHPFSLEFLLRDCSNISTFFQNQGAPNVPDTEQLFNDITGLNFNGEGQEFLQQVRQFDKEHKKFYLSHGKVRTNYSFNYSFNYFFNKSTGENSHLNGMDSPDGEDE